jgi:hypothetical protein
MASQKKKQDPEVLSQEQIDAMASVGKAKEEKSEIGAVAETSAVIRFMAKYLNCSFSYPVVDDSGKQKYATNHVTGIPLNDPSGNPVLIEKSARFVPREVRFAKGYVSEFLWDSENKGRGTTTGQSDAQNAVIGETIKAFAAKRDTKVYVEDEYDQITNYDMWVQKKRRREIEQKLSAAENEAAQVPLLRARIAELEEGNK